MSTARQVKYKKPIENFHGDSIVIGCYNCLLNKLRDIENDNEYHYLHSDENYFYSLDIQKDAADCEYNIGRNQNNPCPTPLQKRFNFVFLEGLPEHEYLSNRNFKNSTIENLLRENAVLLVDGTIPGNEEKQIRNQLYGEHKTGAALYIKGKGVHPTLIIRSLNPDAQKLIEKIGFEVKLEEKYSMENHETFLKEKALEIISNEIKRLECERKKISESSIAFMHFMSLQTKNLKIYALKKLQKEIETNYPSYSTLRGIIENIIKEYPEIIAGLIKSRVQGNLNRILDMEDCHKLLSSESKSVYQPESK